MKRGRSWSARKAFHAVLMFSATALALAANAYASDAAKPAVYRGDAGQGLPVQYPRIAGLH
jgi:hypothetical protein